MTPLYTGDQFLAPPLTLTGGEALTLPGALAGSFGVVLFNRRS